MLNATGTVLMCHASRDSAVLEGEMGASRAILKAGYNIASFLVKYSGVDFRSARAQGCNGRVSPLGIHSFDGVTPGVLELVFPKVKQSLLESGVSTHVEAAKMSDWMSRPVRVRQLISSASFFIFSFFLGGMI